MIHLHHLHWYVNRSLHWNRSFSAVEPGRKSGTKWNQKMMQVAVVVGDVPEFRVLAKPPALYHHVSAAK